jgi:hypothetical protein
MFGGDKCLVMRATPSGLGHIYGGRVSEVGA